MSIPWIYKCSYPLYNEPVTADKSKETERGVAPHGSAADERGMGDNGHPL